jgi:hypothetical protein
MLVHILLKMIGFNVQIALYIQIYLVKHYIALSNLYQKMMNQF